MAFDNVQRDYSINLYKIDIDDRMLLSFLYIDTVGDDHFSCFSSVFNSE